jgi:hypothetical protein
LHLVVGCSGKAEFRTGRDHIMAFELAATKQLVLDLNNILWIEEVGLLCKFGNFLNNSLFTYKHKHHHNTQYMAHHHYYF